MMTQNWMSVVDTKIFGDKIIVNKFSRKWDTKYYNYINIYN